VVQAVANDKRHVSLPFNGEWLFFLLIKRLWCEADHSTTSSTEIKNEQVQHKYQTHISPHLPRAYLNIYLKGGVKIFNSLPQDIKTHIDNPKIFKKAVKTFLSTNSFYSLNEYCDNCKHKFYLVNIFHSYSTVLISNNFQYSCNYIVLLFHCILSYTIFKYTLYAIVNINLPQLHCNQNVAYSAVSWN
jgi:hypothetical protein